MADIKYKFIADGVQTVRDGFKSIGDDARDASKAVEQGMRTIRSSSRETTRETGRASTAQEKFAKDLAAASKQAEIADRKRAADEAKEMRAYTREQERAAKHVAGIKDRYFRDQQKQGERADAVRRKEITKEVSDRRTHEDRLKSIKERANDKDRENERKHADRMAALKRDAVAKTQAATDRDKAKDDVKDNARKFDKELRQKQFDHTLKKRRESIAKGRSDSIKSSVRGAFIGGGAAVVAGTLGVAGAAARQSLALHEVSNRLSISARGAGEEAVDPRVLRKEFERTATNTPGIKAIDVANAVQQFVTKTGNLDVARKSQGVFATVASATGSNVEDISAAAADLFEKFDIKSVEGMANAMSALAFQGKSGAFELKDAAGQFAKLASAASRFGLGKGVESVKTLGGLTQIARAGTGSPEQAATAVEALFRQFVSPASVKKLHTLSGGGVNPFVDKNNTKTKDIRGLIVETITKAGGNQTKLQDIFDTEGIRAISPIITEFNNAKQAASVGGASAKDSDAAGAAAAKKYIDNKINAPGGYDELQRDAAQAQQDASAKMTAAWEKITAGIADNAVPAITKLVAAFESAPGTIDFLIGYLGFLIDIFSALVEASQGVLEFFKIVSKKTVSPEEKRAEARKKAEVAKSNLERFDKARGGNWEQVKSLQSEAAELKKAGKTKEAAVKEKEASAMTTKLLATADKDEERVALATKFEVAKKDVGVAGGAVTTARDEKFRIRTAEQFATEYASKLDMDPERAKEVSRNVAARMQSFGSLEAMSGESIDVAGETEAAKSFRMSQASERSSSAQIQAYGQEKSGENMSAAMARVEAAAKAMEAAAAAMKQGDKASIVPAP
jgi:hypothetical protein